MKTTLTAERLREVLRYDAETGVFLRLKPHSKYQIGSVAGCVCPSRGSVKIAVDGQIYQAHRLAWLHVFGVWPQVFIDHINGVRHDNRLANLREATAAENAQNRVCNKNNKSGFLGVDWHATTKTWRAKIMVSGSQKHIGHFSCPEMAHSAYKAAKAQLHAFNPVLRDSKVAP